MVTAHPTPLEPAVALDLRGLKCPHPVLRVRKALKTAPPGALLVVECTDAMAAIDLPHLIRETGDVIEAISRDRGVLVFQIRKADAPPLPIGAQAS